MEFKPLKRTIFTNYRHMNRYADASNEFALLI